MLSVLTGKVRLAACAVLLFLSNGPTAKAADAELQLEAKIALGSVSGRIDHMAMDLARRRLFVAELGNDSVGVVDVENQKLIRTITGLKEPQGVGYVASVDTLYVANARDGTVRLYQGADYAPMGQIELGDDADNIRVDAGANRVFVGFGTGGLAIIDPIKKLKVANVALKAHPESFQLDGESSRIFVNVPSAREIAVVDRAAAKQTAGWPMLTGGMNFPMALDPETKQVLTVFRSPPRLSVLAMSDGKVEKSADTCGDSDDVFVDAKRRRVYVVCGSGFVDVFDPRRENLPRVAHILTVAGARTGLFVPELDRLFVAVRAQGSESAAIWVFRPLP
jgi:YVTN family beta-propeller protein